MKKIFAVLSFMIFVAACAAPPTNREAVSPANTNLSTEPAVMTEADAIAKEKAVWATIEKKDFDAFAKTLATDYTEVGDDVYDKPGIVSYLKDLDISNTTFDGWKMTSIDKDAILLTYNVTVKGTFKGQEVPPGPYRASSVWINRDGKWQAAFYQETLAKTSTTPPPPSPAATVAGSPAPAATPGDDVVANEKMVWDALKRKDYETFASFLDAAATEVEADGVYDKAGTLRSVRMFDASKSEQSEFKNVKFDADVQLVTYMVTTPGAKPDKERHSTIWVRRDAKWLAFFHQGTPVMPPSTTPAPGTSPSPRPSVSPTTKVPANKM